MRKAIYSLQGKALQLKLVQMRQAAGMTHRQLAERLGREHSFVWRIEHGERRVDVVEFFEVCRALGQDAAAAYAELAQEFQRIEDEEGGEPGGRRPRRQS